jgi:hypothetical protein
VPRSLLRALTGPSGNGQRPTEAPATVGSRFYDGTAFSLGNPESLLQEVQSFLYPLDNTPAMDFVLPAPGGGGGGDTGCKVTGGGSIVNGTEGKFSLDVHVNLKGNVQYRDQANAIDFRSTSITGVVCRSDGTATIEGAGKNKLDDKTQSFTVDVDDNGEAGSSDVFGIRIGPYSKSGRLTRGNVQIH